MNTIFSNLDLSQLTFVSRNCDLCGNRDGELLYSVPYLGRKFNFVHCPNCGLVYQNPILDRESLKYLYNTQQYWEHKGQGLNTSVMLNYYAYLEEEELRRRTAKIRLKWLMPYLPEGASVLDLGCADGLFVHTLSEYGYKAKGIDISNAMIAYGRKRYGVDIVQADLESQWPTLGLFDAITCYATLSNFIEPSRVFVNIRSHLKPGGNLFTNFGDCSRLVSRLLGSRLYLYRPTACTVYSRKTIMDYCRKHGFKILNMFNDVQIVPLARLVGFLRAPFLSAALNLLGLDKLNMRMRLLTGYTLRAVRCEL